MNIQHDLTNQEAFFRSLPYAVQTLLKNIQKKTNEHNKLHIAAYSTWSIIIKGPHNFKHTDTMVLSNRAQKIFSCNRVSKKDCRWEISNILGSLYMLIRTLQPAISRKIHWNRFQRHDSSLCVKNSRCCGQVLVLTCTVRSWLDAWEQNAPSNLILSAVPHFDGLHQCQQCLWTTCTVNSCTFKFCAYLDESRTGWK